MLLTCLLSMKAMTKPASASKWIKFEKWHQTRGNCKQPCRCIPVAHNSYSRDSGSFTGSLRATSASSTTPQEKAFFRRELYNTKNFYFSLMVSSKYSSNKILDLSISQLKENIWHRNQALIGKGSQWSQRSENYPNSAQCIWWYWV